MNQYTMSGQGEVVRRLLLPYALNMKNIYGLIRMCQEVRLEMQYLAEYITTLPTQQSRIVVIII